MRKLIVLIILTLLMIIVIDKITSSAGASEPTERFRFMEQCQESYEEFECLVLWKYGNYPSKPFIDMTGSPMEQVLATTVEPIKPPRQRPETR